MVEVEPEIGSADIAIFCRVRRHPWMMINHSTDGRQQIVKIRRLHVHQRDVVGNGPDRQR